MISRDDTQLYDKDCSTCKHRVERHPSRHSDPSKPRTLNYVCLVCAKAIGEHGCWMHHTDINANTEMWVQEVPCRAYDKDTRRWYALDYDSV